MAQWNGYLIKSVLTNQVFPDGFMIFDSYECTPNQREEIKAYREENSRLLHRITAEGEKSTFKFTVRSLYLSELEALRNWLYNAEVDHKERKIELEWWDMDTLQYRTSVFYTPNPQFKIKRYDDNNILFNERTIEFIEY